MAHYSGLYDIQTLAMLSCVFGGSKQHTTSNMKSSPRTERRRLVPSHTATNAAADIPANVCAVYL